MSSEVVAMATDSSSMTDMTSQPLLAPSATCPTRIQPTPGAQPTCENTHTRQGQEKYLENYCLLRNHKTVYFSPNIKLE